MPTDNAQIFQALGRIEEGVRSLHEKAAMTDKELSEVKMRLTALERAADRQTGQLSGMQIVWGVAKQLPLGLLMLLLGKTDTI